MDAPPKIAFRPVTIRDVAFLAEVYRTSRWDELEPTNWTDQAKRAFLQQQFEYQTLDWNRNFPDATRQIVIVDEQAAGRIYVDRRPAMQEIRVMDIALLPAMRSRGIGTRILQALIAEADRSRSKITLHVEPQNPAKRLYFRLGFAPVRDDGIYLFMERTAERVSLIADPTGPASA